MSDELFDALPILRVTEVTGVQASNGKACAACHGDAAQSMKGVATRYPLVGRDGKLANLEARINLCRTEQQSSKPLAYESNELLGLTAFVTYQSRGMAKGVAIELTGEQDVLGFGTLTDQRWLTARLRSDATMDALVPEHGPEWRALGVSVLHELVLKALLGDLGAPSCRYVHLMDEVLASAAARDCDLACLVPPAGMEHVEAIASNLEKMPPKSTYFYPKVMTGLVLNPLR